VAVRKTQRELSYDYENDLISGLSVSLREETTDMAAELTKVSKKQKRERGASLVEYSLLVALIAVIAIVAVRAVGQKVSQKFSTINSAI
jgi:pilus assembly protein Flp/PilA